MADAPSILESLQLTALLAVKAGDEGYQLRQILRFYSKTFNTPLHVVEALPLEDVLTAYFEEVFANLQQENLQEFEVLVQDITANEAERKAAEEERIRTEQEDELFLKQTEAQAKLENQKLESNKTNTLANQPMPEHFKIPETPFVGEIERKFDLPEETDIQFITPDDLSLLAQKVDGRGNKK